MKVNAADVAAFIAGIALPVAGAAAVGVTAFQTSGGLFCGLFGSPSEKEACREKEKRAAIIGGLGLLGVSGASVMVGLHMQRRPLGKGLLTGVAGLGALTGLVFVAAALDAAQTRTSA